MVKAIDRPDQVRNIPRAAVVNDLGHAAPESFHDFQYYGVFHLVRLGSFEVDAKLVRASEFIRDMRSSDVVFGLLEQNR